MSRAALQRAQATAGICERRASRYLGVVPSTVHYRSRRPTQTELRPRLRKLAAERLPGLPPVSCVAKGWAVNYKRVHRRYVDESLQVRQRRRKRVAQLRRPVTISSARPEAWIV